MVVLLWCEDICISTLQGVNEPIVSMQFPRREGTRKGIHCFAAANDGLVKPQTKSDNAAMCSRKKKGITQQV